MGVAGLWALLKPFTVSRQLQANNPVRMGLDAMVQIHAILLSNAPALMGTGGPQWAAVDKELHDLASLFHYYYPRGVIVVDGRRAAGKTAAMLRMDQRRSNATELETKAAIVEELRLAVAEQDAEEANTLATSAAREARVAIDVASAAERDVLQDDADDSAAADDISSAGTCVGMRTGGDAHTEGGGFTAASEDPLLLRARFTKAAAALEKAQRKVVGMYGPDAACRLRVLCKEIGVPFEMALGEAEHHLHQMAEDGHIDAVWSVDSDTVVVGFPDIIFARSLRTFHMQARVQALNMAQMQSAIDSGVDPTGSHGKDLGRAMRVFGVIETLRILGYALPNDYDHVKGVGISAIAKVLVAMMDEGVTLLTVDSFAAQAHVTLEKDMMTSMKRSAWQFHCQPVAQRFENGFQLHKPDAPRFAGRIGPELRDTSLLALFDHMPPAKLKAWVAGDYDVASKSGSDLRAAPGVDVHVPAFGRFEMLSLEGLKGVAQRMSVSTAGPRSVLLSRINARHNAVHNGSVACAKEEELLQRPRPAEVNLEHLNASRTWRAELGRVSMTSSSRESLWHTPPEHVCAYFKSEPSVRRERESQLRVVTDVKQGAAGDVDEAGFHSAFVTGHVQLSLPPDKFHEVAVQFKLERDDDAKPVCKGIISAICLLAEGVIGPDGVPLLGKRGGRVKHKACRAGGRYCVHIHSLLAHLVVLTSNSTTERKSYWMSELNHRIFDGQDASAVSFVELVGAAALPRLGYKVFSPEQLRVIDKGLVGDGADPGYRSKALALRRVWEEEVACVKDRGLRIDILLGGGLLGYDTAGSRPIRTEWSKAHIFSELSENTAWNGNSPDSGDAENDNLPGDEEVENDGNETDNGTPCDGTYEDDTMASDDTSNHDMHAGSRQPARKKPRRDRAATRANREARQRRDMRSCACIQGIDCSGLGTHGTVFRTTSQDEKMQWLSIVRPDLNIAAREGKASGIKYMHVYSGHFDHMSLRAPSGDNQRWRRFSGPKYLVAQPHTKDMLASSEAFWAPRDTMCICSKQDCDEVMTPANSRQILGDKDRRVIARLYQGSGAERRVSLLAAAATKKRNFRASNAHFVDDARDGRGFRHDSGAPLPTLNTAKRIACERRDPEVRQYVGIVRQATRGSVGEEAAAKRAKAAVQALARTPMTPTPEKASTLPSSASSADSCDRAQYRKAKEAKTREAMVDLLGILRGNPEKCREHTGMPHFRILEATYEYLNADRALDNMNWWHGPRGTKGKRGKGGRPRLVSTFEAYVLFLCIFRSGIHSMVLYVTWWGLSEDVIRRLYITMLHAITSIMGRHQVWPTYDAVRQAVPPKTKVDISATAEAAVLIGDATERRVSRPSCPSGFVFYSDYKQYTSLKYNGVCACNTYLCEITRGYSGCTSDNNLHLAERLAERMAASAPAGCSLLYLYDKGLTAIDLFAQHQVLLMTPWMKRQQEMAVSQPEASGSRGVASSRITIEQIFGNLRTFKVINEQSRLARGHEMDLEMELARCFVNWWPPVNDWLSRD